MSGGAVTSHASPPAPTARAARLRRELARLHPSVLALLVGGAAGLAIGLASARLSPLMVLGLLPGVGAFLVLVRRPALGVILTAALAPLERLGRFTDDATMYTVSLMRLAGLLALAALVLNRLLTRKGFVFDLPLALYGVFVAFSLLSITYSDDFVKSVQMAGTFLGNLLFFFLIVNATAERRLMDAAILVWLLSSVLTGAYAAYDWHLGSGRSGGFTTDEIDPGRGRSTEERLSAVWEDRGELESLSGKSVRRSMGPTSHAAVFGINLILTLPFFLYALRLRRGGLAKALLILGAGLVAYNIFLTNTRSVIVMAAIVALLCLLRGLIVFSRGWAVAALLVLGMVLLLVPADTYNRSLDFANYSPERSATLRIRLAYWDAALRIIRDHWLTGLGSGNERAVMAYVREDAPHESNLHNEYLQTMMEVGVFPALFLFAFVAVLLRDAFRTATDFRRSGGPPEDYWLLVASQVAMLSVLIYGLQVDVLHFPLKGWWLIAGFVCVMARHGSPVSGRGAGDGRRAA
jgi:hypothetical protein